MSKKNCFSSYVKCGEVYHTKLPNKLDESEPPIVLAEVNVNTKHISRLCVLIKFSEFIHFALLGLNPKLYIVYRLARQDGCSEHAQILQEWEFEFESSDKVEIANIDTNQPTVLNYCDCLDKCISHGIIYRLEIIRIQTNNVKSFGLTNESITATLLRGGHGDSTSHLPYVNCGKVFNPVLPLHLSKEGEPVVLTQLIINTECNNDICVLINFSSFVTSILKDGHFNNLTFRLVKTSSDCITEFLEEWRFRRSFVNDTNIIEPLVYNHCECLNCGFNMDCTYTMQLVEAELSKESSYNISQKSMTAQVFLGKDQQGLC